MKSLIELLETKRIYWNFVTIERSEIVLLWCSDSLTKRVLVGFSYRNFSHTLNIDRIVTKPKQMDKTAQGLG